MALVAVLVGFGAQLLCLQAAVVYPKSSQVEPCNHPIDLMILLDSSGSVTVTWNNTIDFTEKLLSNFNIADDQVRVGLIEFSMVANALIPLDSGNSLGRLYQALEEARITPQNGETHTYKALYLAARIFRASPRSYTVPRVLLVITDGELTSGNFSELDSHIEDIAAQGVETFVVAQGDDLVEEGLHKIAHTQDFQHIFSLTPNAITTPYATRSLTNAICNAKAKTGNLGASDNAGVKIQQSTTTIQNFAKQETQPQRLASQQVTQASQPNAQAALQTGIPTVSQSQQQQPIPQPNKMPAGNQYASAEQNAYQEGAWHQNLQQSVGQPKKAYPESTMNQPLPDMPVEKGYENVADKIEISTPTVAKQAPQCNLNITKVGCYRDLGQVPRPLPLKIMEQKDNNFHLGFKSNKFDKKAWETFLPDFICQCANKARGNKFWTFGIQSYNECYSGPDEGRYDEDGDAEHTKCIDENAKTCSSDSDYCSGEDHANYVYTIISSDHKGIIRIEYA